MDHETAANMCKALGDPTRMRIFQFLRCCAPVAMNESGEASPIDGPNVGEVCCRVTGVDKITSTMSFHLKELRQAGLITMEKRGKRMICGVRPEAVAQLAAALGASSTPGGETRQGDTND